MDSRGKGYRFENRCCRILTALFTPGVDPCGPLAALPFRRRSVSVMPLAGHWQGAGDILWRPDVDCPYAVECKACEGWELDGAFYAGKWKPWAWWAQAEGQSERATRRVEPLLLFTRNNRPVYCMVRRVSDLQDRACHSRSDLCALLRVQSPDGSRTVEIVNVASLLPSPLARKLRLPLT